MSGFDSERELQLARRIAISAYTAFRYAMHNVGPRDQPMPDWDRLPDEAQDGWFRSVFVVRAETEDVDGVAWDTIAKSAYDVYAKAVGQGSGPWDTVDKKQKIAWQAAARHILALFESEDLTEEGIEDREAKWSTWATNRSNA